MDTVLIQKVLTHLAYPAGFIGLMMALIVICRFLYLSDLAKKFAWLGIIVFLLSSNIYVANFLTSHLEQKYPQFSIKETPKADAIVVLGGSLSPPTHPRKFAQFTAQSNRFWLAAQLFKAGKAKRIILTGGNVFEKIGISAESIYIRRKLIAMGIPKEAIIVESNSRTTRENATETEKILKKINAKSALLVTSAIHMPRSIQLFSVLSANVIPVPSDIIVTRDYAPTSLQLIPNVNAMALTTKALHEYYGILTESINRFINGV